MPIIKSAKKRVRQTEKATIRNAKTKRTLREAVKAFTRALATGDKAEIAKSQAEAYSAIDIAAKKNILHKNKAARRKAQLNKQARGVDSGEVVLKAPRVKKTAVAKKAAPAKKPVKAATKPKASTVKKEAKKPVAAAKPAAAAKKAPAKKPAAKKKAS